MPDMTDDERDDHVERDDDEAVEPPPGMTVAQLRRALRGIDGRLPVIVQASTDDGETFVGGIHQAGEGEQCAGPQFTIDASDDPLDFTATAEPPTDDDEVA